MRCFVISAIGGPETRTRRRADNVYNYIIRPALEGKLSAVRADLLELPGVITNQVIELLLESELVVADLTGRNPNVYYELALRHVSRKPCVQLIEEGEILPFDIATVRTVTVNSQDLGSASRCRQELKEQISAVLAPGYNSESPISSSIDLLEFRHSHNPLERAAAEVLAVLGEVRVELQAMSAGRQPKDSGGGHDDTRATADEFLVLRRAVRELAKEGVISVGALRQLQEMVELDSPNLANWLGVLASRRALDIKDLDTDLR